jgi:alkanesulfonate monooxygenase SsuD/methylene tetrahydromethanopterin reductase-like flavin-dependent oxidoreductase (luciferase family)
VLTDTLALDLAIALATSRMTVGSFVALTSMRHPVISSQAAVVISDLSQGGFILGLGPGHTDACLTSTFLTCSVFCPARSPAGTAWY